VAASTTAWPCANSFKLFPPGKRLRDIKKEVPVRLAKILLGTAVVLAATLPARAQGTKTLRLEMAAGERFGVENLVGTMRVRTGSGSNVTVVATVHADSQALAETMKLEQVVSKEGRKTLRVRYPLDQHRDYLMPGNREHGTSGFEYDGRRVSAGRRGILLYADLEVEVPTGDIDGLFRNMAGVIHAEGLQGHVILDAANGNIFGRRLSGDVVADTGSGDVKAEDLEGRFTCDSGSGDCAISRFRGTTLNCDTGSGAVRVSDVTAERLLLDTGSGELSATGLDVREAVADTGSGDVALEVTGNRLERVKADSGSGTVTLRLGPDASFEALAETGSGEVVSRYADAEPIVRGRDVVGYRRGARKARITVDTGSGDLVLEPGR
jgi:hypothetical protein